MNIRGASNVERSVRYVRVAYSSRGIRNYVCFRRPLFFDLRIDTQRKKNSTRLVYRSFNQPLLRGQISSRIQQKLMFAIHLTSGFRDRRITDQLKFPIHRSYSTNSNCVSNSAHSSPPRYSASATCSAQPSANASISQASPHCSHPPRHSDFEVAPGFLINPCNTTVMNRPSLHLSRNYPRHT